MLGRDPTECNIVFDKNTPGISGRHCQVVYDGNEDRFLLTDLGSSYGTFLGNGKKLTAKWQKSSLRGTPSTCATMPRRFVVAKE